MKRFVLVFFLFSILFFPSEAQAQRVGLVLSGGGAKGVAHIGVIRALEENQIPIDYVAGTSMGAIVGGLYAAGYSPDEMDSLIRSEDFLKWVRGEVENQYSYYFMQEEPNSSWISLKVNYDSIVRRPVLPSSIVQPFQMDFAFMQIFSKATTASNRNFDSLFVPFRCIASDIEKNQPVTLSSGNLGKAIRASMSYPFYFKPITIDGRVMLDGGMYNNFPSDVMLESFYPDMIIGSKVAGNYTSADPGDIVSQLQTIMMEQTNYDVFCESSVMIEPEIPPVNVIDFSRRDEFMDSGYVAAQRKIDEIRMFLTDSVSPAEIKRRREAFRSKMPELIFTRIKVNGVSKTEAHYINKMLIHNNDTVGIKSIKEDYFRILADDRIAYIFPEATFSKESGYYELNLDVIKDRNIEVEFGGTVSSSPINEAFLQGKFKHLGRQASSIHINSYIGRFYSSVSVLGRIDFPGKTPFYIKAGTFYNQWDFFKTSTMFFEDKTPSYLIKNDFHNKVLFGAPINNDSKIESGISVGNLNNQYYQSNQFSRQDTVDKTFFSNYNTNFSYESNSLNRKQFASEGKYFSIELKHFRGEENYEPGSTSPSKNDVDMSHQWVQLSLVYQEYFPYKPWFSLGIQADLFLSNRDLFANHTSSLLMAKSYSPLPESKTIFLRNFRANNYLAFGAKPVFTLKDNLDLRAEAYIFQPFREIRSNYGDRQAFFGKQFDRRYFMASSRLVYHSPIGPVSMYLNYYQGHEDPLAFGINIGYILFNEHTLE